MENDYEAYVKDLGERNPAIMTSFCMSKSRGQKGEKFLNTMSRCISKMAKRKTKEEEARSEEETQEPTEEGA